MAEIAQQVSHDPRGDHLPVHHPDHLRASAPPAGFNFLLQDRSGTLSVEQLGDQARHLPGRGAPAARAGQPVHVVRSELSAGEGRARPGEGPQASACRSTTSSRRCRPRSAALRERLQPVRPPLPRVRPGGGRLPPEAATTSASSTSAARPPATMIPLSTLRRRSRSCPGTEITTRFNLFRSVEITARPRRGYTSGQALAALEEVFAETMPQEMGFAYSSLSYQEKTAPPAAPTFILAIVFVFLLLAAHVRELAPAVRGAARLAAGRARRVPGRVAAWATTTTCTSRSASSC